MASLAPRKWNGYIDFSFPFVRLKNHVEAESYVYFLTIDIFHTKKKQKTKQSKQNKQNELCVGTS